MSQYYIYTDGVVRGPFGLDLLARMLQSRQIDEATPISGGRNMPWQTVADYPAIRQAARRQCSAPAGAASQPQEASVIFYCPECQQKYSGDVAYLGKDIICNYCQTLFTVTENPGNSAASFVIAAPAAQEWTDSGEIICPHCWLHFNSEDLLYIAEHPSLTGDPVLPGNAMQRFAPVKFNALGQVLDDMGQIARRAACPRCHLPVPDNITNGKTLYVSIVGAPSSGKSYYLATLLHTLRRDLPDNLACTLSDTDPEMNWVLNHYEATVFRSLHRNEVAVLPKTQQTGEAFVNPVTLNNMQILLPKPFVYELNFFNGSPSCNIVFYDNAGEQFAPGADNISNPGTRHLACSNGIIFIFDPLNDAIMRRFCAPQDPQLQTDKYIYDQVQLLAEVIVRIRRHRNMRPQEKCPIPLVLAVGKSDAWQRLFPCDAVGRSFYRHDPAELAGAWCCNPVMDISFALRELLMHYVPELVHVAESFFNNVVFIPCSNFGCHASCSDSGQLGVIPERIRPQWVEVPFLHILSENGLLPTAPQPTAEITLSTQETDGFIVFEHPVHHRSIRLPASYAGSVLTIDHHSYALIPGNSSSGSTTSAPAVTGDSNLWS